MHCDESPDTTTDCALDDTTVAFAPPFDDDEEGKVTSRLLLVVLETGCGRLAVLKEV